MASPFGGDQNKSAFPSGSNNSLFGSTKPGLFGNSNTTPTKSIFGSTTSSSLFAPPASTGSTTPVNSPSKVTNVLGGSSAGSSTPSLFASTATTSLSLFGTAPATSGTSGQAGGLFAAKPAADASTSATNTSTSLFGTTAPSSTPTPSLFGTCASQLSAKPAAEPAKSTATGAQATDPKPLFSAPSGGLFGSKTNSTAPAKPSPLSSNTVPAPAPVAKDQPAASTSTPPSNIQAASPATNAANATKPAVGLAAPSLLRGKTMEDLVTRWTTELDERTNEFKHMADEIAAWDQVLIQNGDQISNLYSELQRIEPVQSSIDQTLDYVESQQAELCAALDDYERQLSAHLPAQQDLATIPGARARTAAQEREQAYRIAEEVHGQLNDMATSLGAMIAELNTLSGPRTVTSEEVGGAAIPTPAEEDPIVQVAGILNAHLTSLNWIGEITQDLGSKLGELERRVTNTKVEFGLDTRPNELVPADDHLPLSRISITSSISSPYHSTPRR
ncbi:hypothetical protein CROQUDRAFT_378623 [Cronartium quercuum f. sp. fusiforme G11]|uniref:Nucleoporin NSP1 n=1 Tax=Cronartium quercuum f. sp. fusiforme G11 TaxID=708437 RepID=A0A9P6NR60_9BASI|nr:hypothetical protein CROQUDRAFT_378623 [Cronartium quercuum f. sp. fusiforme G11]